MKKLLITMLLVSSISNTVVGFEDNDNEQERAIVIPSKVDNIEKNGDNNTALSLTEKQKNDTDSVMQQQDKKSVKEIANLLQRVPAVAHNVLFDYPLETLLGVAVVGVLLPKLTTLAVGAALIVKYKNTEIGEKINATVDKSIIFLKKEWKDISANYESKKQD